MYIPKEERKKLDVKFKRCILVGYGSITNGYRFYDPLKGKLCYSRDVIFNEQKFGMEKSGSQESEDQVALEYSEELSERIDKNIAANSVGFTSVKIMIILSKLKSI